MRRAEAQPQCRIAEVERPNPSVLRSAGVDRCGLWRPKFAVMHTALSIAEEHLHENHCHSDGAGRPMLREPNGSHSAKLQKTMS
jgi:hypothetical protein